jgi:hypothetical protein
MCEHGQMCEHNAALICSWCPSELLRPDSKAQGHFYSTSLVSDFMSDSRSIMNQDPQTAT